MRCHSKRSRAGICIAMGMAAVAAVLVSRTAGAELNGHGGAVMSIAVSPDGKSAISGGFDYSLIVWDLREQSVLARLFGHDAAVN